MRYTSQTCTELPRLHLKGEEQREDNLVLPFYLIYLTSYTIVLLEQAS